MDYVSIFKAALTTRLILMVDQMSACNVKGGSCSDKLTEDFNPTQ